MFSPPAGYGITSIAASLAMVTITYADTVPPPELPPIARGEAHGCQLAKHAKFDALGRRAAGPPVAPTDYDVLHYDISIDVDFVAESLSGEVVITAQSLVPALGIVEVDLANTMTISSITRSGAPLVFTHADDRVAITLDQTLGLDDVFVMIVQYSGQPEEQGLQGFAFDVHQGGAPIAATLSEPWFARSWWPCKETPTDKATADISFTAPASMIAASNGLLADVTDNGATKTWHWQTNYPTTTYLISAAITDYVTFSDTYTRLDEGTMPVEFYCYPEHEDDALASWGVVVEQMNYYRTLFGEYPFADEKYGMAEFPWGGAMEHQTLTSIGECCVSYDPIIAHELAHQWWGDFVTCASWADIWLNEGFASWSEALWWGEVYGPEGYREYMGWMNNQSGYSEPIYRYDLTDPWGIFDSIVYDKGAWVVHMLRGVLGDTDFFAGLDAYGAAFAYASATTEDLEASMESVSGMELDWFFDQWIYGAHRPDYEYAWLPDTPEPGQMTLRIDQVQSNAPAFTMPIQIDVTTGTGVERFTVWNSTASESFVLDVGGTASSVVFDPDDWILDWHQEVVLDVADVTSPGGPSVLRVWPTPFTDSVHITFRTDGSGNAQDPMLTVFDITGRHVRSLDVRDASGRTVTTVWDGTVRDGSPAAPGVYFVRLRTPTSTDVRRIVRTE